MRVILMFDVKSIMLEVFQKHNDASKWRKASFEHIKRVSNTKVGEIGQDFIEKLCEVLDYSCIFPLNKHGVRAKQNPWDIEINGIKFELKTATEDVSGSFQFNHIRYHRAYDGVMCLGVGPEDIYFNLWSKAEITTGKAGSLVSMEKGANASYKLTKKPSTLHDIDEFDNLFSEFTATYNERQ